MGALIRANIGVTKPVIPGSSSGTFRGAPQAVRGPSFAVVSDAWARISKAGQAAGGVFRAARGLPDSACDAQGVDFCKQVGALTLASCQADRSGYVELVSSMLG